MNVTTQRFELYPEFKDLQVGRAALEDLFNQKIASNLESLPLETKVFLDQVLGELISASNCWGPDWLMAFAVMVAADMRMVDPAATVEEMPDSESKRYKAALGRWRDKLGWIGLPSFEDEEEDKRRAAA